MIDHVHPRTEKMANIRPTKNDCDCKRQKENFLSWNSRRRGETEVQNRRIIPLTCYAFAAKSLREPNQASAPTGRSTAHCGRTRSMDGDSPNTTTTNMTTIPNAVHKIPIAPARTACDWIVRGLGGLSSAQADRQRDTVTICQQKYSTRESDFGSSEFRRGACTSTVPTNVWTAAVSAAR